MRDPPILQLHQTSRRPIGAATVTKTMDCLPLGTRRYWHDDADVTRFMARQPRKFFELFQRLRVWAHKADLWRYLLIHERGGVYLDAESTLIGPLTDHFLQPFSAVFVYEKSTRPR